MSWLNWLFPTHARCMGCNQVRLPAEGPPFCIQCRKGLEKVVVPKPRCGWWQPVHSLDLRALSFQGACAQGAAPAEISGLGAGA